MAVEALSAEADADACAAADQEMGEFEKQPLRKAIDFDECLTSWAMISAAEKSVSEKE
jgi:hypothetical protein